MQAEPVCAKWPQQIKAVPGGGDNALQQQGTCSRLDPVALAIGVLGQRKGRASSIPYPAPPSQSPSRFSSGAFLGLMQFGHLITLN